MSQIPYLQTLLQDIINQHSATMGYPSHLTDRLDTYEDDVGLTEESWASTSHSDIRTDIITLLEDIDLINVTQRRAQRATHDNLCSFSRQFIQVIRQLSVEQSAMARLIHSLHAQTLACRREMESFNVALDKITVQIEQVQSDVAEMKVQIEKVESEMAGMKKDLASLNRRMDQMGRGFKYAMDVSVYEDSDAESEDDQMCSEENN